MNDARKLGFKNSDEIANQVGKSRTFIYSTKNNNPQLYQSILMGAALMKLGYELSDMPRLIEIFKEIKR